MKTMIAIPCMDLIHTAFVQSLMQLDTRPLGDVSVRFNPNSLIYDSRNLLSIDAINNNFDAILWLDSDMTFPPDTARKLLETAEQTRADLVTGLYFRRRLPTEPVLYKTIQPPTIENGKPVKHIDTFSSIPDQPFPVAGCGFGCTLTRTSLIKSVWEKHGPPFSPFPWAGEDLSFCFRAQNEHAVMFCNPDIPIFHVGLYEYGVDDFERSRKK